jgi:hypothetical protein
MAVLGLAVEACRPWCSDGIAAQLLHAVVKAVDPSTRVRASMGFALSHFHDAGVARIQAADVLFELAAEPGREVHDHVQVLAPIPFVVLAGPDPVGADLLAGAPGGDAGPQTTEEVVQLLCRVGVEMDWVEVERGHQRSPDDTGEAIGPANVAALLGRDPFREALATVIPLELGSAANPASPARSKLFNGSNGCRGVYGT